MPKDTVLTMMWKSYYASLPKEERAWAITPTQESVQAEPVDKLPQLSDEQVERLVPLFQRRLGYRPGPQTVRWLVERMMTHA